VDILKKNGARLRQLISLLDKEYPEVQCALRHQNPLELLVATILSAQCTDERVNLVTPELFHSFRTPADYARASRFTLEKMIHSTGFFRNKAKNIQLACQRIETEFQGRVPQTMEELLTLPGVARKTANVVLGTAFGIATGVVVDTHVFRLSHRMGLSNAKTPEKVEQDLIKLLPQEEWIHFSHRMIHHGRRICKARKPACLDCALLSLCPRLGLKSA
jgi:endonuclease-3